METTFPFPIVFYRSSFALPTVRGALLFSFADGACTAAVAVFPDAVFAAAFSPEQPAVAAALRPAGLWYPHRRFAAVPFQFAAAAVLDCALLASLLPALLPV